MSCEKYRAKLNEYLDGRGELPEEHVRVCADCASDLEELRRVRSLLSSLPALGAPQGFRQAVMGEVRERSLGKASAWQTVFGSWWTRSGLATAAVAAAALVALHVTQPPASRVPLLGARALAEMANLHTDVQVAYVVPSDSPAPKGDVVKPAKDEYEDLYQVDGM